MTYDRRESIRKWATLVVSSLVLLVTSLREPIASALGSKMEDNLRRLEAARAEEAKREKQMDSDCQALRQVARDLAALREEVAASEGNRKLLVEINTCLVAVEGKLDLLVKEQQRERQPPAGAERR